MVGVHWARGTVRSRGCRRGRGSLPVGAREAPLCPAYTVNALPPELDQEQAWTCGSEGVPLGFSLRHRLAGPGQQPPSPVLGCPQAAAQLLC